VEGNGRTRGLKPFQPGQSGNPHRGPSKVSTKVKESLVKFLEDNIDAVQESFDKLKPLEKLQFVANILPYVVPKLQSVESDNKTNITGGITIRWEEPDLQAGQDKSSVSYLQSFQAGSEDNNQSGGDQIDQDI
jgi:hypothetical protein